MPMEAQVRPLPSELTTPPVTKMCLAIKESRTRGRGQEGGGGKQTPDPEGLPSTNIPDEKAFTQVSCRGDLPVLPVRLHELLVILDRVHADGGLADDADADLPAGGQDAELLQLFQL